MDLKYCLKLFLILFFSLKLGAQEADFVRGTLIDVTTSEPIVFATIRLKERAKGVITNKDGSFRIPLKFQKFGEVLVVSCLGYETKEVSLSTLVQNKNTRIYLRPSAMELIGTVLVGKRKRPPTPRQIVKRAIERIPDNYSFSPFSYVGYYRDYQVKDGEYLNMNQSILKVFDSGFNKNDFLNTQTQIFNYDKNYDFKRDADADIPYDYMTKNKVVDNAQLFSFAGNEFFILRIHDAIRNYNAKTFSYIDILERDLIKNHSLERKRDIVLGEEKMFVIEIESDNSNFVKEVYAENEVITDIKSEGRLYISQSTYAIHKLDYKVFDQTESRKPKNRDKDIEPRLLYEIAIEYSEYDGKMYPNYLSVHNAFKVRKAFFRVEQIVFDMQKKRFVITTNNPPLFYVERNQPNIILKYKNKRVQIKEVRNLHGAIIVVPDEIRIDQILRELEFEYGIGEQVAMDLFQFEYINIRDASGNALNNYVYEDYDQYREFFTQQVITDSAPLPEEQFLMKKDRPIFKDQPILKPNNFDDFWMNTPLKSIE